MSDVLYIAAKAPLLGKVKTRLASVIGDGAAVELYRAFLVDLAARFPAASWYVTPLDEWERAGIAAGRPCLEQPRGDWTERQRALFRGAADRGERRTVLIASDSPQLSQSTVREAFALLDSHDVVFGPVTDGGYYLIGMHGSHDVLRGIGMSTGRVLDELLQAAAARSLRVALLEATYDVDEAHDLELLAADAARSEDLPATRAALDRLGISAAIA